MRVIGYIPLHYGKEYLRETILSMLPWVEELWIIYSSKGSQGHHTNLQPPDTKEELYDIAMTISEKVKWADGEFFGENKHREWILQKAKGFDLVFTLDSDEIVNQEDIGPALEAAYKSNARQIAINGFINFWKSFDHVCMDGFQPIRIQNLRNASGQETVNCRIYHFGYCQRLETMQYKWNVSGHKNELRNNWINSKYLAWSRENQIQDLHPVAMNLWNAQPFDKTTLPELLKNHPNYNKAVVE